MREIRFRVLDKKKNRLIMPEEICRLHFNEGLCYCVLLWTDEMVMDFELIDFTGLKDKNGKEIYEGDILFWNKRQIVSQTDGGWNPFIDDMQTDGAWHYEVIGNIYENPELISEIVA